MAIWVSEMKLDCHKCSEDQKREHGFYENAQIPWELDGQELWRCPLTQIKRYSYEYIQAFSFLESGYGWPNSGGWQQQPAKFIDAINVIKSTLQKVVDHREQEENKKSKGFENYGQ